MVGGHGPWDLGAGDCPLVDKAGPRASAGSLGGEASSWSLWLQGPGCPWFLSAQWWAGPSLKVWFWGSGVPGLVPMSTYCQDLNVYLGLLPIFGLGCLFIGGGVGSWALLWMGSILGQLGAQDDLGKPSCWWVGLYPHLSSCLAWGVPVLVSIGWWARLCASTNKLKGRFQNCVCQHQCPCGIRSSPKWLLPVSMSPEWAPVTSCLSRGSLRSAGGSDPSFFQITASALHSGVSEHHLRGSLCFSQPSHSPKTKPHWLSKPNDLSFARLLCWGAWHGDQSVLGKNLCNCNYTHVCGSPTQGCEFWIYCVSVPPTCLIMIPSLYLYCRSLLLVFKSFPFTAAL